MQQGEDIWHIAALYNYFVLEPAYKLGDLDCLLRASSMRPPTKGA